MTGDTHQQPFRDLVARGCTCTVCARVRARQDLCAMAEAADRPWIVDELLEANPDLNPWTIGGDSRQLVTWKCHRCGTVDAASPHSRLTSTTGVLPCCRALAKEQTTDVREKKSRKAPAVHQRATVAQLQALRAQSLGTIGLRTPTGGSVTVAGAPANLTLYDPAAPAEAVVPAGASKSRNTPFAGMELPGRAVATFLRGVPTVLDGKLA